MQKLTNNLLCFILLFIVNSVTAQQGKSAENESVNPPGSWLETIQYNLENKEYNISFDSEKQKYQSPNRANNVRAYYEPGKLTLKNRVDSVGHNWDCSFTTSSINLEDEVTYQPEEGIVPQISNNKIEFTHPNFTEQYINSKEGTRQNFIIHESFPNANNVSVSLTVQGLEVNPVSANELHLYQNVNGIKEVRLVYKDLVAWDANGKKLDGNISFENKEIRLTVQTAGAAFPITIDPIYTAHNPILSEGQANANFGVSVSTAGDVNGDGYDDVIVGASAYDNGQTNEGAAFVYHGSSTGLATSAASQLEVNQAGANFGYSVSTAGDVNGDGLSDVIVGAYHYDNGHTDEGVAFVYHGTSAGVNTTAITMLEGNQTSSLMGCSVSSAGDVNGDGYSDVVVGAYGYDNGQGDEGAAFIYQGSLTGIDTSNVFLIESNQTNANFGRSVAMAGDVNGDGYADVLVGAPIFHDGHSDEGAAFVYHGTSLGLDTSYKSHLECNKVDAYFGISVSSSGDINGDGYSDVVVGANGYDNGQFDEGAAFVYHGSDTGINVSVATQIESNQAEAYFGLAVSSAGDVNGDGYSDVIVGASLYDNGQGNEGAAFVYFGSSLGIDTSIDKLLECNQSSAYFGSSVSTAGDINGDGFDDVILGAYGYDNDQTNEGAAFIYYGSNSGFNTKTSQIDVNQASADFGISVSTAGDVNNDDYSDVIVGARFYDNGQTDEGAAFVFHGSSDGLLSSATTQLEANQASAYFGNSVSTAGDVNDDGYSDVIVGAFLFDNGQSNEGAAFVYHGSSSGIVTSASSQLENNQTSAYHGVSVASAGDVNNDGYADVIVGASLYDNGNSDEGAAFVYHGSSSGISTSVSTQLEINQTEARMGTSVSSAGDVNNDGYDDVIVGAIFYDNGQTDEGGAFVYHGSSSGISTSISSQLEMNQASAYFGRSVAKAGDVNSDGYSDIIVGADLYDNGLTDEGSAFVFHGSSSGVSTSASTHLECNQASANFGISVSSAGDANGDGFDDVVVGAHKFDNGQTDEGTAFVFLGSTLGVNNTINTQFETNQASANMGISVSLAGDINNDGFDDVIVGANKFDNGQTDEGAALIFYGSSLDEGESDVSSLESNQASANMGISVSSAGDVNGDGYSDVIVGASNYDNGQTNEGAAFIYRGTSTGIDSTVSRQLENNQANANMGQSVSSAGDVNGDGYGDVIVGAYLYDNGQSDEGAAFVYHGSDTGINVSVATQIESNQADAYLGVAVSSAGDVNGDGYSDVIVGASLYDDGQSNEGSAFVYHGSASGVSSSFTSQLQINQANARAGTSISSAGDVNGDGYSDVIVGAIFYDNGLTDEGGAFVYHGSVSGVSTTASSQLEVNQATAYFGRSVSSAGDVNGDGYSDVIVGADLFDNGSTDEGGAFVFHGSASGIGTTISSQLECHQADANMGISVSSAGDMNGDGYADVIVGALAFENGETDEGAAFVYHGSSSGINTTVAKQYESNQANANLGKWVSSAGDVNGDGLSDMIVGAHNYDNGQSNEGAAFIYYGATSGTGVTENVQLESNQAFAALGIAISSAGDVNGDGYSDVIIGASQYDNGQSNEGAAFVYHGSLSGLSNSASRQLESNQAYAYFGGGVSSAGDVNGDGYSDVIVGAPNYDNGQTDEGVAFLYHGSPSGIGSTASATLESNQSSSYLGYSVSSAGDVNGDGYSDVIVGAAYFDNGQTDEGAAFVYHGSSSGISTTASKQIESDQASSYLGLNVSDAGDVNGDGYSDVIVGALEYDNGESNEGAAFIYHGSSTGITTTNARQLEVNQASAYFGVAVSSAGDVNGDGYSDVVVGSWAYENGSTDEGAAFVYLGSAGGINNSYSSLLESNQASSVMGFSVSTAGDVNGDGYSDVIVGAYNFDNGQSNEGAAFVYHGSSQGLLTLPNDTLESNQANSNFGYAVASAGDVNGDGFSDLIVGALNFDNGQTDEGAAFIYNGNNGGGIHNNLKLYDDDLTSLYTAGSDSDANIGIGLFAKSPEGRAKGKLVYETIGVGDAFSSASPITNSTQFTGQAGNFTDLGLSGTELKLSIPKRNGPTRIRARVKYDASTSLSGAVYGPWRYLLINPQAAIVGALPVDLVSFNVEKSSETEALLRWQTASEVNNRVFEVERLAPGESKYQKVGEVSGAGNSMQLLNYHFVDDISLLNGQICYRLKQVDFDDAFEYTEVRCISKDPKDQVVLFPNPATDELNIQIERKLKPTIVNIYNVRGQLVLSETIEESTTLDVTDLIPGVYIVNGVSENRALFTQRLVIGIR